MGYLGKTYVVMNGGTRWIAVALINLHIFPAVQVRLVSVHLWTTLIVQRGIETMTRRVLAHAARAAFVGTPSLLVETNNLSLRRISLSRIHDEDAILIMLIIASLRSLRTLLLSHTRLII